jgi:hypothetical protein
MGAGGEREEERGDFSLRDGGEGRSVIDAPRASVRGADRNGSDGR